MYTFSEFFAGGGMARAGLGADWQCVFANDFDSKKGQAYSKNWGDDTLQIDDIRNVDANALPSSDLIWASFPCQDLSLAGGGAGLKGERSGTFYPFWDRVTALVNAGKAPKVIALENVVGALTSHSGKDFAALCNCFEELNYQFGALVINAHYFVPQSRPRLFIIGVRKDLSVAQFTSELTHENFHTDGLKKAVSLLPKKLRDKHIFWKLPLPPNREISLASIMSLDLSPNDWHSAEETEKILQAMTAINLRKIEAAKKRNEILIGTAYRRTRSVDGVKLVRVEVRFDGIAGCLRTPSGGSSRQLIIYVKGNKVRSRLISTREAARLMGLPDSYHLPERYNDAYHLIGDGVAVPVVSFLASNLFSPILACNKDLKVAA